MSENALYIHGSHPVGPRLLSYWSHGSHACGTKQDDLKNDLQHWSCASAKTKPKIYITPTELFLKTMKITLIKMMNNAKLLFPHGAADNENEDVILLCTSFGFVSKFDEQFCLHFRHRSH